MKKLFFALLLAAGCHSNPYCLNCKDGGSGVVGPADLLPPPIAPPDLAGTSTQDLAFSPDDLLGATCTPQQLLKDPNNCGMCGHVCTYVHAEGQCMNGMCQQGPCQPGWVHLPGDPSPGCNYQCAVSNGGVEICDGVDNDCNGIVDDPFTTTWSDAQKQHPNYDKDIANCGTCGNVCSLGPGTVMACQGDGTTRGQCKATACFNGNDANGVHQTYRHDPSKGLIDQTGCEYHCPFAATQTGTDCNPNGACTFPKEICNGLDDDCNFLVDDNLTDPGLNGPCPDNAPGKLCSGAQCNNGLCKAGTYVCNQGGLKCMGSVGPSPEICDGKNDENCDGQVDEPWTATWNDPGHQVPRYDVDPNNCGACAMKCALANATNGCHLLGGASLGTCYVAACNPNWFYVTHEDSNPSAPACDVSITQPRDSTPTQTGIGCNYNCGTTATSPEVCDGKDNDCDGCIDNGLTPPSNLCANKGVCANQAIPVRCSGGAGWKCDYSGVPNVSIDVNGNLTALEKQCDDLDNNCNGPCDENFPDVQVSVAGCTNVHAAKTCTAGQGVCQATGPFVCSGGGTAEACSATANAAAASDEKCNGKDDDCNGLIDEPTDYTVGGTTFKGWHDPVVAVAVAADPIDARCSGAAPPATCAAHTVYVYQYEASRPDATPTGQGSLSTRACANAGVMPWSNVTLAQAQAACAGIVDGNGNSIGRLCSAWEWQQTCNGNAAPGTHWSMSASTTSYVAKVCNDVNAGVGAAWATGSPGAVPGNQCFVSFAGANAHDLSGNVQEWTATPVTLKSGSGATGTASAGQLTLTGLAGIYPSDAGAQLVLTGGPAGDTGTFTITSVLSATSVIVADPTAVNSGGANLNWSFVYEKLRGGNYATTSAGGDACEFDFDIQKATFANNDVGFRCCADAQP